MKKTVLIIGAGPAGLTAAYKFLKETDIHPIIVESEAFVGGISRTALHNGNRIDIGGHRFFSKNEEVVNIWKELLPVQGEPSIDDFLLKRDKALTVGGPDPEKEDLVLLIRSRVSRIFYLRKFFDYPITLKLETITNLGLINTIRIGFEYVYAQVFKRKEENLEDYMINKFGKSLYKMFFEDYTEKVWGRNPKEISAEWGAQRIKGLSLTKAILNIIKKPFRNESIDQKNIETSLIEQFYYPKKGPGQLWEAMANKIVELGGEIVFNSTVIGINTERNTISSVIIDNGLDKKEISADYFFSSMPIKDLVSSINRNVPKDVKEVAINLPYRDFMTAGILVNKLKIKNTTNIKTISNIVPDCWIYIQEPDVKVGRMQIFNNWSPYMVKDLHNTVWIGLEYFCNESDDMWDMSEEEFLELAISEADKIGIIDKIDVLDSVRIKVKKAYPAYFGTYENFDIVRDYLDGFKNLYCIGRNGQHRYNNMDHSMLTAMEAVRVVINGGLNKSSIWNINTESEYHEEKLAEEEAK